MGLLDRVKSVSPPSLREIADRQAPELAERIVTQLSPLLSGAVDTIDDDQKFLVRIATPLFRLLPPLVQLVGRERLRWDPIMLDMRDHVLERRDASVAVRANAVPVALAVLRKHFTGEQSELLVAVDHAQKSRAGGGGTTVADGRH